MTAPVDQAVEAAKAMQAGIDAIADLLLSVNGRSKAYALEASSKLRIALASQQEVPDAQTFCQSQVIEWATSKDWMAGWDACRREFPSRGQQEVAAPVGVVSVSPLHVGVGWVGGYVPKNGDQLYLAASRVPVASPAEPDMRAICEALGFDPTNHHNAAKCPYCRPATPPVGAGGVGVMDAGPDSVHLDSGECGNVQGPGPTDAERVAALTERASWVRESTGGHWVIRLHNKRHTSFLQTVDAILAKGGDQGEGK